ncbi:MAG: PQQ-like beta-propeller repeat protein, partial [Bacteroidales bacterium]|nr:PQQ-like beta-propeller repeat protein [Bacteroidales bacterium]
GWHRPDERDNIPPNSPLFKDGKVFFSQGYDIGAYMLQLSDDLRSAKQVWKNDDMDTHHGGYVLVDGVIYGTSWKNNTSGDWCALDWNTGKTLYAKAWSGKGKGSIIYADGLLYCYDERRGTIGIVVPDGKDFKTISEVRVDKGSGPYWAHLTLHNGILYARHGEALVAYKVK